MMRILTLLIPALTLFVASCAPPGAVGLRESPGGTYVSQYDFRPYTEQGFLFITDSYWGPYESMGLFTLLIEPEVLRTGSMPSDASKQFETMYRFDTQYMVEIIQAERGIERAFEFARQLGADAIMNFRLQRVDSQQGIGRRSVEVSGFAIKRGK